MKARNIFYKIVSLVLILLFTASPLSLVFADTTDTTQSADTSTPAVTPVSPPTSDTSSTPTSQNPTTSTGSSSLVSTTTAPSTTVTAPTTISNDSAPGTTVAQHQTDVNTALSSITPKGAATPDIMASMTSSPGQLTDAPQLSLLTQGKLSSTTPDNSGALEYSYPLTLPPGRNNMTPDVALQYNSQNTSNDSVIGYGWNLSIPYIARENKHGVDQLYTGTYNDYTTSDKGELGQISGNTYQVRAEDGSYTQYVYSSAAGWTVTTKDGMTYTYGTVAASRQDDPGNSANIYKWVLDKATDTNGNFITYTYFKDQGQIYPSTITYTNTSSGNGPFTITFGRETVSNPAIANYTTGFSVTTQYRINSITIAVSGTTRHSYALAYTTSDNTAKSLLSGITETGIDPQGDTKTLPQEKFTYTNSGAKTFTGQSSTAWPMPTHSLTGGYRQDSRLGMSGDNTGVEPNAKNGILIDINGDGIPDWIETENSNYQHDTSSSFGSTNGHFYDVWLGNAAGGWTYSSTWTAALPVDSAGNQYELDNSGGGTGNEIIDVNGDGLPDFIITTSGSTVNTDTDTIWLNNGNGWTKSTTWTMPTMTVGGTTYGIALGYQGSGSSGPSGYTYDTQLIDVNNDGLPDIVQTTNDNFGSSTTSDHYSVWLNTGTGWSKASSWTMPVHPTGTGTYYGSMVTGQGTDIIEDINGDGLPDWVETTYSSTSNETYDVWLNTGSSWVRSTSWALPVHTYTMPPYTTTSMGVQLGFSAINCSGSGQCGTRSDALMDINGDGLPDFVETTDYLTEFDTVWLNNGKNGWVRDNAWLMPMKENNSGHDANEPIRIGDNGTFSAEIADVNNDGLPDFIASCDCGTTSSSSNPQGQMIFLNTGYEWALSTWGQPSHTGSGNYNGSILGYTQFSTSSQPLMFRTTQLQDVNGDGSLDWIESNQFQSPPTYALGTNAYERYEVWLNSATQSDLLSSITNPKGGSSTFTYAPQTILDKNSSAQTQTVEAVTSVTTKDGLGSGPSLTSYSYTNGKYFYNANKTWRRFAGFQTITTTRPDSSKEIDYYHQGNSVDSTTYEYADNEYLIGRLYRTDITDGSGNLYKRTTTEWSTTPITSVNSNVSFIYPTQTITEDFDGNATERATAETWAYNTSNGNLTTDTSYGEVTATSPIAYTDIGTDESVTTYSYANNGSTMYLPSDVTTVDQSSNKVNETQHYYDNLALGSVTLGNETKTSQWKTSTTYISTQKSYNTNGTVASTTDGRGYTTTNTTYDTYGFYPITVTDPMSHVTHYTYDYMFGNVVQTTDPNSQIYITNYDGFGRVISQQIPDPTSGSTVNHMTVTYTDNATGTQQAEKYMYTNASVAYYIEDYYDGLGRLIEEKRQEDPNNNPSTYQTKDTWYDTSGRVSVQSLPYLDTTGSGYDHGSGSNTLNDFYTYDSEGRVLTDVNNLGTTTNSYDQWETVTTDPNGNIKHYFYDAYGNLVQVDEINSGTTYSMHYFWNLNKNLTKMIDSAGNIRNFIYDGLGNRLTAQDLHLSSDVTYGTWAYSYDNDNNLSQSISPNNATVNYTYDNDDRKLSEDWTGSTGTDITYTYDTCTQGIGRLCTVTMLSGANTSYTYDYDGNVASENRTINSSNFITSYTYNRAGNIVTITYPDSATVQYNYISDGLLSSVQEKESGGSFANVVSGIAYSPDLQISYMAYNNGVNTTNTYDSTKLYRLTNKLSQKGSTNLQSIAYTYDADGNLTNLVDSSVTDASKTVAYTYDNLNRLKTATATGVASGTSPYTQSFIYDALGNITSGPLGTYLYQGSSGTNYADPDAATSINGVTYTYDKDGNLTGNGTLTSIWNYKDQVTQTTNSTGTFPYAYDQDGNRVEYNTNLYPNKYYAYNGSTKTKQIFIGDTLIATFTTSGSTVTPYYVQTDNILGTNLVTDSTGTKNILLDYYPFGDTRVYEHGSFTEKNEYSGHPYDSNTIRSYLGARYYEPKTGLFVSEDPTATNAPETLLMDPQQLNTYAYARDNPITGMDPDGRSWTTGIEGAATGLLVTGAVALGIASLPVTIPAAAITGLALLGTAGVGYGTYSNYHAYQTGSISKDQFDYNAGSLLGGLAIPGIVGNGLGEEASLTGVQANKAAGDAFENAFGNELAKSQNNFASQITLKTQSGIKVRPDFISQDSAGEFCIFECKSSANAPLTKNQSAGFPEIEKSGGTIVGNGKPGFPGGTVIPPTKVNIVRPN